MREVAVTVMSAGMPGAMSAARPQLIRALNEQLLLGHIRDHGPCSRADLARLSGLSKPTVSLALATVEQAGLIQEAGQRIGRPGRSALLYEIKPEAGFVLGLDVGAQYLRGALADLAGEVRARSSARSHASGARSRVEELVSLAGRAVRQAGLAREDVTQTVIGSPGVYDPGRGAMALTGGLARLGPGLPCWPGCGRRSANLWRWRTTGRAGRAGGAGARPRPGGRQLRIRLGRHRHRHGPGHRRPAVPRRARRGRGDRLHADDRRARRRPGGRSQARRLRGGGVRARRGARRAPGRHARPGLGPPGVATAMARGDERAAAVVAEEAALVARVLRGGDRGGPGTGSCWAAEPARPSSFAAAVTGELRQIAPVMPEVRVSALGTDAVVDGCLAAGAELARAELTVSIPGPAAAEVR